MSTHHPSADQEPTSRMPRLGRRSVVGAAVWSVPVVTVASAAPAFAVSDASSLEFTDPAAPFAASQREATRPLSVTLLNGATPVAGKSISFSVTGASSGWLSFTTATAVTDSSGVATTTLQYGTPKPLPGSTFTILAEYAGLSATTTLTYTPNLVVARVGSGAAALSSAATAVFLREYTQSGSSVAAGTVALPTAASGGNKALTQSGTATSASALSQSADRRYVTLAGYDAATGTASATGSASATVNRVVARVDGDGVVDTTTALSDAYTGDNIRAAATSDGTSFYTAGNQTAPSGGTRFAALGATASTMLSTTPTNIRTVSVFSGQVYVSSGSGAFIGVSKVGTGTPTTAGQTTTLVASNAALTSPYGFVFLDRSSTVSSLDTLYVADDGNTAANAGVHKFSSADGTTWTYRGKVTSTAARGITGFVNSTGAAVLFFTNATGAQLMSVTETAAYDAAATPATASTVATAETNTVFRGVSFAPGA